jgi:hypothetical protein
VTDEARLERLTELARRVWPDEAGMRIEYDPDSRDGTNICVHDGYSYTLAELRHPRALDALEAALLVLAREGTVLTREQMDRSADMVATAVEYLEAAKQPLPWVESLASEWQARASARRERAPLAEGYIADTLDDCAAELRERAQRGE